MMKTKLVNLAFCADEGLYEKAAYNARPTTPGFPSIDQTPKAESSEAFMMKDERAAHALLLPLPFQGHITPIIQLGDQLAALGLRVTLVTTDHLHAQILRSQDALPHPITTRHAHFKLVGLPDGLPDPPHSTLQLADAVEALEDDVLHVVDTLAAEGCPVTCIVTDYFLRWSPSLASRTSLPEFIFWPQCATVFAIFSHLDDLRAVGFDPFAANEEAAALEPDPTEKVRCIPSIHHLGLRYADLPCRNSMWRRGVKRLEGLIKHRQEHMPSVRGVLVNSFDGLEGEAEVSEALSAEFQHLSSSVRLIGPLTSSARDGAGTSLQEEQVECMEWLDEQPTGSVIFIAFGSLATLSSKAQVEEVARGLVASGQRFLWVVRKDAIQPSNGEVVMNIEDILPSGFLDEVADKGRVISWASQVRVLSHPAIGGFFSHCGWNSTLESIAAGVPILGWPFFVDQFPTCRLMSHVWGVGVELQRNSLNETTSGDVAKGVEELMQGPHAQDMRARATELKSLAHKAMLSSRELHALVDDINKLT